MEGETHTEQESTTNSSSFHHEDEGEPELHLIAVDGGESSEAAFRWAAQALPKRDRFFLLHGLHDLPMTSLKVELPSASRDSHANEIMENHRKVTDKYARLCREAKRDCTFGTATFMSGGELGGKICSLAEAKNVSSVICGSEGKGALERVFLGTTSASVLAKCKCPVLVVKAGDKHRKANLSK